MLSLKKNSITLGRNVNFLAYTFFAKRSFLNAEKNCLICTQMLLANYSLAELPKKQMKTVLGVDVGGNHVKMALVDSTGAINQFQSYYTSEFRESGDFIEKLIATIRFRLVDAGPEVKSIGIGFPGTLSKDRNRTLEIPAISELNGKPIGELLKAALPDCEVFLENDANAAALGELHFSKNLVPDDFAFITLGTGIGSAYVQDRKIFIGADGNALELGHIISRNGLKLEQNIGKQGILNLASKRLADYKGETTISKLKPISATEMVLAAGAGDLFSREVFYETGNVLGEGLVALIRILDVKYILIGGGLSASFEFVKPGVEKVLFEYLTPYYLDGLVITKASLGNDAGLLGAASLCL